MLHEGLYLRTLGGLSLENGGRPILGAAGQRGRLAILAVLSAGGARGVSRDRLLALFWPDSDTEHARGALNQAIYALRRDAGERELTLGTTELRLNPAGIRSDTGEFEAALAAGDLARAVELYAGPFLDGIHLNEAAGFDRWLDQERERLGRLYHKALGQLARDAEGRSDYPEAVRRWRELATSDSLSASVAGSLMRALVRMGDSAAALQHARIYQQVVRDELDVEPDASINELVAQIRSGADMGRMAAPGAPPEPAPPSSPARLPAANTLAMPGRWKRAAVGAGAMALAIVLWTIAVERETPVLDSDHVLLHGDRADSLVLAELAHRLTERDRTLNVITDRRGSRARYVVSVTSSQANDSIRLEVVLTDATTQTRLTPIQPVVGPPFDPDAIRRLGDRVAVALATHRDPFFANWAPAAAMPVSWESFQELALGIRAFTEGGIQAARSHFRNAASLDSISATAWLWEAFVTEENGAPVRSDSVLVMAERSGRRYGPWERALSGFIKARNRNDIAGAHAAGHQLLDVVPESEWGYMVAWDAIALGRAAEAVALTDRVRAKPGWTLNWPKQFIIRGIGFHLMGDFQQELELAREALRSEPDSRLYLQLEGKALASMGRAAEVTQICDRGMSLRPGPGTSDWQPCAQAVLEFLAHGYPEAARSLAKRFLVDREQGAGAGTTNQRLDRAGVQVDLMDWPAAERSLKEVPATAAMDPEYLRLVSLVQAFRRDSIALAETRRRIATLNPSPDSDLGDPLHEASLAALLGDRERAVALLTSALRGGSRSRRFLHWAGPFDLLRGYPPFDLLVRPVEDSAHLAQVLRFDDSG